MFKFYYDCIGRFDDRKDFQYVEMDTDAPLQTIPKPGMKREVWDEYGRWFPRSLCEAHNPEFLECMLSGGTWVQGDCCK